MTQLGIYYNPEHETIIIGYIQPTDIRNFLVGRVIGHTGKAATVYWYRAYNTGYEYNDWTGFVYIGRYTTYTTLQGYLDLLKNSTTEQIEAYFKCKKAVEEYMKSYVVFRKKDGHAWYERHYNKQSNLN